MTSSELLLIEDNPADRELIEVLLSDRDAGGWLVASFPNLAAGLDALRESESAERFAAILLDLSLPDSHGLETLCAVQELNVRLPIVVLTGNNDKATALEAVQRGAQDYLFKDSLSSELLGKSLQYAIERKRLELHWRDELEARVRERTEELSAANRQLESEVTERRAAQAALEDSQRFIEKVMNATPAVVFVFDIAGRRITYVNEQLETALGMTLDDVRQCDEALLLRILHPDDVGTALANLHKLPKLQDNEVDETLMRFRHPDGSWRWLMTRCVPFRRGADGKVRLILGAALDVTDLQVAQEEIRSREEQLVFVSRQALLGEFAAALAHELNQPLSAAVNYSQAALRHLQNADWSREQLQECLAKISQQSLLSGEIIKRLRRMVAKRPSEKSDTDVADMIRETVEMIRPLADRRHVRVRCDIAGDLPHVQADRIQLQQVLLNLIRNGLDAMQEPDTTERCLEVTAGMPDESDVEIGVCDEGIGCDARQLSRLFEPFFTTKPEGLGIGLSISRSIVEAHGGTIVAQPNRHRGLTVRFTVPLRTGNGNGHGKGAS